MYKIQHVLLFSATVMPLTLQQENPFEDSRGMGCDTLSTGKWLLAFRRYYNSPSAGYFIPLDTCQKTCFFINRGCRSSNLARKLCAVCSFILYIMETGCSRMQIQNDPVI